MLMFRLAHIFFTCIINILFFAIVAAQNPLQRTASISGRVTVDGKPAINALVKVVEVELKIEDIRIIQSNGRESVDRHGYKVATNTDGNYIFTGLPAGKYVVSALSMAYVSESGSQEVNRTRQITLDEGEAREKVDFALVRGGVITGRVTDDENRPQIQMGIMLAEISDTEQIKNNNNISQNGGVTDDRGVYRIYGIRAGRYIVGAGHHYNFFGKPFEHTYHPNTTNAAQAQVIEVKEGSEVAGVDIRLVSSGKTYEIMGRVIEAETGKAVPQIRVNCIAVAKEEDDHGNGVADGLTDIQGNFRLTGLRPGKYKARLNPWDAENPFYAEGKYFEIDSENVTGLELKVNSGGTISGMVLVEEGKERPIETTLSQATVTVQITQNFQQGDKSVASKAKPISPDKSFQFIGIPPGKARFGIGHDNRTLHILRVEHDGTTQTDGINVKPGENISGVKIIVVQGTGVIRGEVKVVGGNFPENCNLFVLALHNSIEFGGDADVDDKGRFLIEGLLNGNYTLHIQFTNNSGIATTQMPKLPKPITQNVSVSAGAETRVNIIYDLSRVDQ
jgi:hypothetical protein